MLSAATALPETIQTHQQPSTRQAAPQVSARPYFGSVPVEVLMQDLTAGDITEKVVAFVKLNTFCRPYQGKSWRTYRAVEISMGRLAKALRCDESNVRRTLKHLETKGRLWRRGCVLSLTKPRSEEERQAWPVWCYREGDLKHQRWLLEQAREGQPVSTKRGRFDPWTGDQTGQNDLPSKEGSDEGSEPTGRDRKGDEGEQNCTDDHRSKRLPPTIIKRSETQISGPVGGMVSGAGSLDRPTIETSSKKSAPLQSMDRPTPAERELWRQWCTECGTWGTLDRTLLSYMRRLSQDALIALIRRRTPDRVGSPSALLMNRLKEALTKSENVSRRPLETPTTPQQADVQHTSEPPGQSLKDLYPYHVALGAQTYEDVVQIYSQINTLKLQGSLPDEPGCLERLASGELEPEPPGTWRGRVRVEQRDLADKSTALQSSAELDESDWEELDESEWKELDEGSLSDAERAELEEIRAVMERSFSEGW